MAETSTIEWTDATWNPVTGCSVVSPGCTNCYAMKLAGTRLKNHPSRAGLTIDTKAGPVWNGQVRLNEDWLDQPLRWSKPRRIFVCAHGDLFHEDVPDDWIDRVFAVMALAQQHTFQVLTKRASRMRAYMTDRAGKLARFMIDEYVLKASDRPLKARSIHARWPVLTIGNVDLPDDVTMAPWPLPNVWLGVSAENQTWLDLRAPHLLETPAAVRFLSAEPLLQPLDLQPYVRPPREWSNYWANNYPCQYPKHRLDWVIVGGESGPRPMHPDWVRKIRDECTSAGVPFFFKQWGDYAPASALPARFAAGGFCQWQNGSPEGDPAIVYRVGKKAAGRLLDGRTHDGMPGGHG